MNQVPPVSGRPPGEGLGRSWRSFCLLFSPSFFTLIFYRYFLISEGVLGRFREAKVIEKSRFGMFFWDMLLETSFSNNFCWIFEKFDDEKHVEF